MGGNKKKVPVNKRDQLVTMAKRFQDEVLEQETQRMQRVLLTAEAAKSPTVVEHGPDRLTRQASLISGDNGVPSMDVLTFDSKPLSGFGAFSIARASELAREGGATKALLDGSYDSRPGVKKQIREEWDKMPALHNIWQAIARHHDIILSANTPRDGRCVAFLAAARPTAGFETFVTHRIIEQFTGFETFAAHGTVDQFDNVGFECRHEMLDKVAELSDYLGKVPRTLGNQAIENSKQSKAWPYINALFAEWWEFTSKERIGWLNLGLCLMAARCGFRNQIAHGSLGWGLMSSTANGFAKASDEEAYRYVQNATVAKLILADYSMARNGGVITSFAARALTWRLKQTKGNFTCIISGIINKLLETAVDEHGTVVAKQFEPWDRLVNDVADFSNSMYILPFAHLTEHSSYRMNIDDYFMAISDNVLPNSQHPFHQVVIQICESFKFVTDVGCVEKNVTAPRIPLVVVCTGEDEDEDEDDYGLTSDEPTADDKELLDECLVAIDKFAQQRADDEDKIPNMPAPKPAPKPAPESESESNSHCVICFEGDKDHLCMPCKHLCVCAGCASVVQRLKACPMCREPIVDIFKVFA